MKNRINYSYLTGDTLNAFVRSLLAILDPDKMEKGILTTLTARASEILVSFSKGFERETKDPLTKLVDEKDALRDRYFNGLKNHVKSYLYCNDNVKSDAAEKLIAVVRKHGWSAASFSLDRETTAITSLIAELNEKFPTEVALLSLTDSWLSPLAQAQAAFEQVQKQRIELGAIEAPSITMYRQPLIDAVKKLINTLETMAEVSDDATLINFAGQVDELIGRTMAIARSNVTRRDNQTDVTNPQNPVS